MDVENRSAEATLKEKINELKKQKGAVILAHYYQQGPIRTLPTISATRSPSPSMRPPLRMQK